MADRWLIVGCSRRKLSVDGETAAIRLYEGGLVPEVRALISARPELASSTSIISGKYGLLAPTDLVRTYDLRLDSAAAVALRRMVTEQIRRFVADALPRSVLVLAEPPYAAALAALDDLKTDVQWCTNLAEMPAEATRALRSWGWLASDQTIRARPADPTA